MRRTGFRAGGAVLSVAVALMVALGTTVSAHAHRARYGDHLVQDLVSAYVGTARYHSLRHARRDGYAPFPAGVPLHECIDEDIDLHDHDGKPAMGVHWINGSLVDGQLDPARPEVLVLEPRRHGRPRLVALEYVVFESDWGSPEDTDPPQLFGRDLQYIPAPNRYGVPAFYEVHAWLWKENPDGLFANMNPRVSCAAA